MSEVVILSKTCPKCGTAITSLYQGQLDYNYKAHVGSPKCKRLQARLKANVAPDIMVSKGEKPSAPDIGGE